MKTNNPSISRRNFISSSAAASSFFIIPSHLLGKNAPSNKLNIAGIGIGGMGGSNLRQCRDENIVALCDVDVNYAAQTIKRFPKARVYEDYRVMFDKEKDIDAVIIATPDHTHAVITMRAIQEGKHVFCQKPLTHTVHEARVITEAARKAGVQTQMGNQGHSSEHIRLLKEWLDAGAIGNVTQVYAWTDRPAGGNPWSDFAVKARSPETPPVPEGLNWDLWLGPVPYRPYHPDYHPTKWRAWLDFGTGALGDMGCHILDPAFYALELGSPESIQAASTHWEEDVASETFPRAAIVRYKFPARGDKPPVDLTWYDGRLLPPIPRELEKGRKIPDSGAFFIGDKGVIMHGSHGAGGMRLIPETQMKEYAPPPKTIPRVKGSHEDDWIRACKEGKDGTPASSNFNYGGPLTEMVLLGMIAIRMKNQILDFDAESGTFKNHEEANELLHIKYRKGWML
ncbi:Gfo/Idh/MocA family oxidoreductase [candidate division KSB1 bacterium]|nr:Gfo/Idh/MocA family oxidoreductase [candidate division KSB1 bacterium]